MILIWLIVIPFAGGLIAWLASGGSTRATRWISLGALLLDLLLVISLWRLDLYLPAGTQWIAEINYPWIPEIGAGFHLAMDGLSLLMVALTVLLGIAAVIASWNEIQTRVGFFHFALMASLAGVTGVFLAVDLVLFYFFWEVMLVPMYLLIGIWGTGRNVYAGIRFFVFTQAGGLLMLVAILGLYFVHASTTGVYTFDYFQLLGTQIVPPLAMVLMLGFFAGFAVKLPMFPLHVWAPDTYTSAPTAGSVLLAGVLSKTAGYGLLRFVLPLFPEAAALFAPVAMVLGVIGILYGAVLAFGQTDVKRLVAYSSVSHLGFVLLGIFALNRYALQGAVVEMLAHGFSIAALFILVGWLEERTGTREMDRLGGLWATAPRMGAMALIFVLATLGLPGFGNFIGEFLVLVGAFRSNVWLTFFATGGLILVVTYALRMMLRVFMGENQRQWSIADLSAREIGVMAVMTVILLALGFFPQLVIETTRPLVKSMPRSVLRCEEPESKRVPRADAVERSKHYNTEPTAVAVKCSYAYSRPIQPGCEYTMGRHGGKIIGASLSPILLKRGSHESPLISNRRRFHDGGCSKGEMVSPFESRRSEALFTHPSPRRSHGALQSAKDFHNSLWLVDSPQAMSVL